VLSYFGPGGKVLPRPELNTLQRKSGVIPPSQGVIIDARGRIAHQAVGYGDDWYLPFNLKNLKALKGGEYIRTRTFGGPTTEDIYTGLISGAHAVTVVSHNGVYSVEFDDNLRGGRRFNDKAARMVGRYGHLLDAVKEGQITTGGIDPTRLKELEDKAARTADPVEDPKGYREELDKLKAKELLKPTLSAAQRQQAAVDFLAAQAENVPTADGHVMNPDELVRNLIDAQAGAQYRSHAQAAARMKIAPVHSLEDYRAQAETALRDNDPEVAARKVAEAMGKGPQFNAWMKRAEADNAQALTPLRLDGQGYKLALDALQEQFPYYIARVDFHPWANAHNATDTGYVKPRHNRPAAALAGYYDTDITGHGKVRADSTRFQNYAVRQGKLVPYAPAKKEETKTEAGGKGEVSAETAAELRASADRAMLDAILNLDTFGPEAKIPQTGGDPPVEVGHMSVATVLGDRNAPKTPLDQFHGKGKKSRAELEAAFDDPARAAAMHTALKQAYDYIVTNKLAAQDAIPTKVVEDFTNEGRASKPKPLPARPAQMLADSRSGKDFDLGKAVYEMRKAPSREEVATEYGDNALIQDLVRDGVLPADVAAADFKTKADALHAKLLAENDDAVRAENNGMAGWQAKQKRVKREAEGLARARQLRRRYDEAADRERQAVQVAPTTPGGDVHQNTLELHGLDPAAIAGMSDEEWETFARRVGLGGTRPPHDNGRVIEG
jgi:hypothetical protein